MTFSFKPFRRTSPRAAEGQSQQEISSVAPNIDEMIENIDRVMGKWRTHIGLLDQKYASWELNEDNSIIPPSISSLLISIDRVGTKNGTVLGYGFYKRMVRRSLALWDVDPSDVVGCQTGDPEADDQAFKRLISRAISRTDDV